MSNDKQFIDFKKEVEKLKEIDGAEEYAKQLAHLFLGNGLSLQTILLMAINFGQQHPHWIPVEEMLPKVGEPVWFYTPSMDEPLKGAYQENGTWYSVEYECKFINGVTHWTKIQPPRKEE